MAEVNEHLLKIYTAKGQADKAISSLKKRRTYNNDNS